MNYTEKSVVLARESGSGDAKWYTGGSVLWVKENFGQIDVHKSRECFFRWRLHYEVRPGVRTCTCVSVCMCYSLVCVSGD